MEWIDDLDGAWDREFPDVDTSALPPLVRLTLLSERIEAFQHGVLEPFELTPGDYSVLATLRRAGNPYALNPSRLYSRLRVSSGGMTKMLGRLEERDLIKRKPDPSDGRGSVVSLTRRGLTLQDRVFQAFLAASQNVLAPLSNKQRRDADRVLRDLLGAFEGRT